MDNHDHYMYLYPNAPLERLLYQEGYTHTIQDRLGSLFLIDEVNGYAKRVRFIPYIQLVGKMNRQTTYDMGLRVTYYVQDENFFKFLYYIRKEKDNNHTTAIPDAIKYSLCERCGFIETGTINRAKDLERAGQKDEIKVLSTDQMRKIVFLEDLMSKILNS